MEKKPAVLITDGSLESAVLCAIARQRHELVVLDCAGPELAEAVERQVQFARPVRVAPIAAPPTLEPEDARPDLARWSMALSQAVLHARSGEAAAIFIPLRAGATGDDLGPAAEFVQIWEELLRHAFALSEIQLAAPLLDLELWQVVDLAAQLNAPLVSAHGETHHAGFVRAARAKP